MIIIFTKDLGPYSMILQSLNFLITISTLPRFFSIIFLLPIPREPQIYPYLDFKHIYRFPNCLLCHQSNLGYINLATDLRRATKTHPTTINIVVNATTLTRRGAGNSR